jgi:hypothetical protein
MHTFSPTLGLWTVNGGGHVTALIQGTPEDFRLLADAAAKSGGLVFVRVPIQPGEPPAAFEATPDTSAPAPAVPGAAGAAE